MITMNINGEEVEVSSVVAEVSPVPAEEEYNPFVLDGYPTARLEMTFPLDEAALPVLFNHSGEALSRERVRELELQSIGRRAAQEALLRMDPTAPSVGDMEIAASLILPPGGLSTEELLCVLDPLASDEVPPRVDPPPDDPRAYIWPPPEELPERVPMDILLALEVRVRQQVGASLKRMRERLLTNLA